jgi:flagellar basal body-associated protein FliL
MNKKFKIAVIVLLVIIVAGGAVAYNMFNKPRRNVADEKGIEVTSAELVKEFQANETQANAKYLDKAIQVSGKVNEVKTNQEGKMTIMLASDDAMTGVFCTLKETAAVTAGSDVIIKGICSGMLSDVRLREAVVVK